MMDVGIGAVTAFVLLFSVLTLAVGYLLRTHGLVFLELVFGSEGRVAPATNALLNIGYYLLSLSLLFLNAGPVSRAIGQQEAIEVVATRLGRSILVIAVIHFINMLVFASFYRRADVREAEKNWRSSMTTFASQS